MLRLGYPQEYICEFYYALPSNNHLCVSTEIGLPLSPLIDEEHMTLFKKMAPKGDKLVHVYVLEVTVAEARVRQHRDQEEYLREYNTPKSKGVVIEEIEGPPLVVPNKRPRKKTKLNPGIPLLGWYERDVEFQEYLVESLAKAREEWKKDEALADKGEVSKNLMEEFASTAD